MFYKVPGQFNISTFENFEIIALKGNDFNTVAVKREHSTVATEK